jgi:hypothetical protein
MTDWFDINILGEGVEEETEAIKVSPREESFRKRFGLSLSPSVSDSDVSVSTDGVPSSAPTLVEPTDQFDSGVGTLPPMSLDEFAPSFKPDKRTGGLSEMFSPLLDGDRQQVPAKTPTSLIDEFAPSPKTYKREPSTATATAPTSGLSEIFAPLLTSSKPDVPNTPRPMGFIQGTRDILNSVVRGAVEAIGATLEGVSDLTGILYNAIIDPMEQGVAPEDRALRQLGSSIQSFASRKFPRDPRTQNQFKTLVLEGLGGVIPFAFPAGMVGVIGKAAGMGGKTLKVLSGATLSGTGAARAAGMAYDNAVELTNDEDKRLQFTSIMGVIGLTEAIPFMRLFSRLNRPTRKVWMNVVRQFAEEGVQESLAQGAEIITRNVIDLGPTISLKQGLKEAGYAGLVGGTVGGIVGGGGAILLNRLSKSATLSEQEKQVVRNTGDQIGRGTVPTSNEADIADAQQDPKTIADQVSQNETDSRTGPSPTNTDTQKSNYGEEAKTPVSPIDDSVVIVPKFPRKGRLRFLWQGKPRWGKLEINFKEDLDKALYIVANPKTVSKRHDEYMEFIRTYMPEGMSDAEIQTLGVSVRNQVTALSKSTESQARGVIVVPRSSAIQSVYYNRKTKTRETPATAASDPTVSTGRKSFDNDEPIVSQPKPPIVSEPKTPIVSQPDAPTGGVPKELSTLKAIIDNLIKSAGSNTRRTSFLHSLYNQMSEIMLILQRQGADLTYEQMPTSDIIPKIVSLLNAKDITASDIKKLHDYFLDTNVPIAELELKGLLGPALNQYYKDHEQTKNEIEISKSMSKLLLMTGRTSQASRYLGNTLMGRFSSRAFAEEAKSFLKKHRSTLKGEKLDTFLRELAIRYDHVMEITEDSIITVVDPRSANGEMITLSIRELNVINNGILQREGEATLSDKEFLEKHRTEEMLNLYSDVTDNAPTGFKAYDLWITVYRYFNMLSNPRAQKRNTLGGYWQAFLARPASLIGQGDFRGLKIYLKGIAKSKANAILAAKLAWSSGNIHPRFLEGIGIEKGDFEAHRFKRAVVGKEAHISMRAMGVIGRSLETQDKFFSAIIQTGESNRVFDKIYKAEVLKIRNNRIAAQPKGVKFTQQEEAAFAESDREAGAEIARSKAEAAAERLAESMLYRTPLNQDTKSFIDIEAEAQGILDGLSPSDARRAAERGKNPLVQALDHVRNSLTKLANEGPQSIIVTAFIPFIRTPIDIGKRMVEFSPIGYIPSKGLRLSKEDIGRANIGSLVCLMGGALALTAQTTGRSPKDEEERRLFFDSGRRPWSILLGKKWVPMWWFGPFAGALAIPAAWRDTLIDDPTLASAGNLESMASLTGSLAQFYTSQTPLQGTGTFLDVITGRTDFTTSSSLAFTAGQFIPASGFLRWANQLFIDPVFRKGKGFEESFTKDYPWGSRNAEAYRTSEGELAVRDPVLDILSPYSIGEVDERFEQIRKNVNETLKHKRRNDREVRNLVKDWRAGEIAFHMLQEKVLNASGQVYGERRRLLMKLRNELDRFGYDMHGRSKK